MAVYKAIKPKDTGNDKVFLVMGPWHHGQEIGDGSTLGALRFRQRHRALLPPRDPAAVPRPVPQGRRAARPTSRPSPRLKPAPTRGGACLRWPAGCASGCTIRPTPLYLNAGLKLSFAPPEARRRGIRRICLRPRQARALPRAARSAHGLRRTDDPGRIGWWTTSAKPPAARTCWRSSPMS